ncbi:MAG: protease complex subunit PrcB family protein [Rubrobacter sp.]|nr:protease complex subunit PrcB family protein [Rubrobacter sp.]
MRNHATHRRKNPRRIFDLLISATLALILSSCAGGEGPSLGEGTNPGGSSNSRTQPDATTPEEERMLEVRRIDSGSLGQGDAEPRAVVASSSETLSAAAGIPVRGAESTAASGEETYVAVLWGEKNTGGYTVEVESATLEGGRVAVSVALRNPPEGAMVSQALTYPYAVAALENLDPEGKDFVITDESGSELEWPVETV